jgi:hypothetical protein
MTGTLIKVDCEIAEKIFSRAGGTGLSGGFYALGTPAAKTLLQK